MAWVFEQEDGLFVKRSLDKGRSFPITPQEVWREFNLHRAGRFLVGAWRSAPPYAAP